MKRDLTALFAELTLIGHQLGYEGEQLDELVRLAGQYIAAGYRRGESERYQDETQWAEKFAEQGE